MCDHNFVYGGVKYEVEKYARPGRSKRRYYFDWFYCTNCTTKRYNQLDFNDIVDHPVKFNATPK